MENMDATKRVINKLKAGASYFACGGYLSSLDKLHRTEIYNTLGFERLERKNRDITRLYEECDCNWPQTFYMVLLRTMGGIDNKEAFTELARRVPYAAILREKMAPQNIEAMLIGATGLSAVPMASRVANDIATKYDPKNHVLNYCMSSNISGVIGSAVAAGVLISFLQ